MRVFSTEECVRPLSCLVAMLLASTVALARPAAANTRSVGAATFPAVVPEPLVQKLVDVGRVGPRPAGGEPEAWKRWGRGSREQQERAVRAVVGALAEHRPPIHVSAAILAIARVESGFNPFSQNPNSTACGIFQFIKATWLRYASTHSSCTDPAINAGAGVRHLTLLHDAYVRHAIAGDVQLDELERVERTYRLMYAYHYHGESSKHAVAGGSPVAQQVAEAGLGQLRSFYDILKRATAAPTRVVGRVGRPAPRRQVTSGTRSPRRRG
jgi:hypothetical protein